MMRADADRCTADTSLRRVRARIADCRQRIDGIETALRSALATGYPASGAVQHLRSRHANVSQSLEALLYSERELVEEVAQYEAWAALIQARESDAQIVWTEQDSQEIAA
jgi:uncharacterized cupin superfamily protein